MKILMRGGKSPFQTYTYEETLAKNILGTNSGNLIFAESTWKTLNVKDAEITMNGYSANPKKADYINENFDVFILPFANAFRPSFQKHLDKFSELIEKLTIPVVVIGVGAQDSLKMDGQRMATMEPSVKRFCAAVLERSASIGVRGEYTYKFLRKMGFADDQIDIIGCPSMFYFGDKFPEINKKEDLGFDDQVSMNVSPYVPGIAGIFDNNYAKYKKLQYVPQNNESLDQILWDGLFLDEHGKVFPKDTKHDMFQSDRIKFFIDPQTWLKHLNQYDFVFGTRIHGNIMALLAGTPAFVMAHDSRTLELSEYFDIPHMHMDDISKDVLAKDLFEKADYTKLLSGHSKRFDTWVSFLEKNKLRHVYQEGEDSGKEFEDKISKVDFPGELSSFANQTFSEKDSRLKWSANEVKRLRLHIKKVKLKALKASSKNAVKSPFLSRVSKKIKRTILK